MQAQARNTKHEARTHDSRVRLRVETTALTAELVMVCGEDEARSSIPKNLR